MPANTVNGWLSAALSSVLSLLLFLLLCIHNAAMAYNKVPSVPRNNAFAATGLPDWATKKRRLGYIWQPLVP